MSKAIAVKAQDATAGAEATALVSMIERAARDPAVDIDKMERLWIMHERAIAGRARAEYLAAFSRLQAELPAAVRGGTGHNKMKYARYEDLITALRPVLAQHGFSISHRVNTDGKVIVTGILGHAGGHAEETTITLPADASGNKSPVHALASSISYGKRYVTLTLTGIATADEDDDAQAVTTGMITPEQVKEIEALAAATGVSIGWICEHHSIETLADMTAKDYAEAKSGLSARKRGAKS